MGNFNFFVGVLAELKKCRAGDKIEKNELGWARGAYG